MPKVSVLMPVRGADPHLAATIRGVLDQDYPDFDLRIIVDSRDDPAWNVVTEFLQEAGADNVHLSELFQGLLAVHGPEVLLLVNVGDDSEANLALKYSDIAVAQPNLVAGINHGIGADGSGVG